MQINIKKIHPQKKIPLVELNVEVNRKKELIYKICFTNILHCLQHVIVIERKRSNSNLLHCNVVDPRSGLGQTYAVLQMKPPKFFHNQMSLIRISWHITLSVGLSASLVSPV